MKENNMFIYFIFFYSAVEFPFVNSVKGNCDRNSAVTDLHRFNNHILRRRIRSLVFPKKAQLVLTSAFSKAVLDGRPRGLLYSVEFDMYYTLPDSIDGWKPTMLENKLKNEITASKTLATSLHQATKDSGKHDQNFNDIAEDTTQPHFLYNYYNFPFLEDKRVNDVNLEWKSRTMNFSNREFGINLNNFNGFTSNFHKLPYSRKIYKRNTNLSSNLHKKFTKNASFLTEDTFRGFQSDREREQIHKQFEIFGKIFNINMKKCIHRAICELNSQLSIHGESVIQDIIRLILIPPYGSTNIPIGRAKISNVHCKRQHAVSCPFSTLDSFTKMFSANT